MAQAAYYLPTAIAPFVSRRGFESVTGPKRDWWLVLTVGVLVGIDGAVLAGAAARGAVTSEVKLLGAGSAAGLAAVDITYAARGEIARTYWLDGAIQLAILAAWFSSHLPRSAGETR